MGRDPSKVGLSLYHPRRRHPLPKPQQQPCVVARGSPFRTGSGLPSPWVTFCSKTTTETETETETEEAAACSKVTQLSQAWGSADQ